MDMCYEKPRVWYKGKDITLQELSRLTGISYRTLYDRYQRNVTMKELLKTPKQVVCRATSAEECYDCPWPDCVRSGSRKLSGEMHPSLWS